MIMAIMALEKEEEKPSEPSPFDKEKALDAIKNVSRVEDGDDAEANFEFLRILDENPKLKTEFRKLGAEIITAYLAAILLLRRREPDLSYEQAAKQIKLAGVPGLEEVHRQEYERRRRLREGIGDEIFLEEVG